MKVYDIENAILKDIFNYLSKSNNISAMIFYDEIELMVKFRLKFVRDFDIVVSEKKGSVKNV